jgi:hypothetical protein
MEMIVTTKEFERTMRDVNFHIDNLKDKYWKLELAHLRLLSHLGLKTQENPKTTILVKDDTK